MTKIDRRIDYKVVLDNETCPLDKDAVSVSPWNMFVYDIGWGIFDKHGNTYRTRSFVVKDIFLEEIQLMNSAYYANKLPQYWEDIKNGSRILATFDEIKQIFLDDIEEYEVKEVYAHNMRFDYGALTNTQRWLTKSKYRQFFPNDVKICDTLKMAQDVLGSMPTYRRFCEENGYMTKHRIPQCRFTAEILYRFINKDSEFIESHTALEDVMIEKEIMAYCYRQHKKMRKLLWED